MRINTDLYNKIIKTPRLWRRSDDMIISRNHDYLNDTEINIVQHVHIAGLHTIHFKNDEDKEIHFFAKRKHYMLTRNPEGKLVKTIVYTGSILRKNYPKKA